jgi:hypothetical protein
VGENIWFKSEEKRKNNQIINDGFFLPVLLVIYSIPEHPGGHDRKIDVVPVFQLHCHVAGVSRLQANIP